VSVYYRYLGLADLDGATESSFVAADAQYACANLRQGVLLDQVLNSLLEEHDLKQAHLNMRSQFINK
jgi:hypothetical protein